jgi:CRP-like cAMP-binding protein
MLNAEDIHLYWPVFKGLKPQDVMELAKLAHTKKLKPGEVYIQQGSASQRLAYIKSGLIRTYSLKENGDDVTLMLRWEDQFVASVDSVILGKPSRFIYQALEDTVLMEVDYHKAKPIIDTSPELSVLSNSFVMHMLGQAMDRVEGFVLLSPGERYLKLIHEKPGINNRVPDKYLATMLGITPVSLSRIRKRIALQHKR